MSLSPAALEKLRKSIDGVFDIMRKQWELAHMMNNSTARNDLKKSLRYTMDQLNIHKIGLTHIQETIDKILRGEDGETSINAGE